MNISSVEHSIHHMAEGEGNGDGGGDGGGDDDDNTSDSNDDNALLTSERRGNVVKVVNGFVKGIRPRHWPWWHPSISGIIVMLIF